MRVRARLEGPNARLPAYQTAGSAGCDVHAAEDIDLPKGVPTMVRTGLFLEVPEGYECQVRSRSGLASKGVIVLNSPGTLDSDYRGELRVLLYYVGPDETHYVLARDRIAQLVFSPVVQARFELVDELPATDRGAGGFGSTGVG